MQGLRSKTAAQGGRVPCAVAVSREALQPSMSQVYCQTQKYTFGDFNVPCVRIPLSDS